MGRDFACEIATSGAFLVNAEGSTGGAEVQGSDCVRRLPAKNVQRILQRGGDRRHLGRQPPPGRSFEDAAAQDRWLDDTISYSGDGRTAAYVTDPDRWAEKLGPLMKQAEEAGTCTQYREAR